MIENVIEKIKGNKREFVNIILAVIFIILVFIFLINFLTKQPSLPQKISDTSVLKVIKGDKTYNVNIEIARTETEQEKGLMYRQNLGKDDGMLFIFNSYTQQSFWMKNTLIPLDIMFFDIDGNLLNIAQAQPCPQTEQNCPIYPSNGPAKYVLEVNKDWAEEKNMQSGNTKIELNNL